MIPVICTTNIEPELINEFLVKAYAADTDASENLCVLTTQDWSHYRDEARLSPGEAQKQGRVAVPRGGGPMESPSRPPWTKRFETPFKNRDPEDIAQNLQTAEGLLSTMNKDFCVVLDGQTVQDKRRRLSKPIVSYKGLGKKGKSKSALVPYLTQAELRTRQIRCLPPAKENAKRTAAGIPTWSPTVVLICRSTAYVWQSGRDAQFSADCG
ncbi:hypothetical protein KCU86_g8312, partial [Aureobasidium melanogenum]